MRRRIAQGVAAGCLAVSIPVAGCTSGGRAGDADPEVRTSASAGVHSGARTPAPSPTGCPDVTGEAVATNGAISAGPFSADALIAMAGTDKYKVWVGTRAPEPREITLSTRPPDASPERTYRRTDGTAHSEFGRFFPGLVDIPVRGTWQFHIVHGVDEFCFTVEFPRNR